MAKFNCFCSPVGKKKKNKGDKKSLSAVKTLPLRLEHPVKSSTKTEDLKSVSCVSIPFEIQGSSRCNKIMNLESPVKHNEVEVAYEGEDEHDDNLSMKRDYSDFDLQARVSNEGNDQSMNQKVNSFGSFDTKTDDQFVNKIEKLAEEGVDMMQSGHVSDPGIGKAEFWASPKLKRSCSNLETDYILKKMSDQLPLKNSQSFEEMHRMAEKLRDDIVLGNHGSPRSETTHFSADKVMLKKHSSSQILPSRSRRLWWKLFLWSHRNLQTPRTAKPPTPPIKHALNQQGGYSSDTLEPSRYMELSKLESPRSFTKEPLNRDKGNNAYQSWEAFQGGVSGLLTQNQWVAFPTESSLTRVDEWVKELATQSPPRVNDDDNSYGGIALPPSPSAGGRSTFRHQDMNLPEEIVHANNVIQSLNSSSKVAHISGIGLKVIPTISRFSSLRSINLSGNLIVHITPGSLPKGLHTLNLSRNKISTIEGFRELTRLRVLDLSYNRISRIGQGLSNCTLIKELYIAGNKISDVEGLHRLLKLTVLDLSFNKITTTKALGQVVANYNTLVGLNLLGNPIQSNISDDQLRKAICSLLPKLVYLNKQPINPHKAREVAGESVAKAALGGNNNWSSHRRTVKRVSSVGGSSSSTAYRSSANVAQKSKHRSKSASRHHSTLKTNKSSAALASSSHILGESNLP
ncbi:uncharacterized protein LOC132275952 [Cornus florida]|uniref:uncharacterized protein LOC132275952 n=1 Tax=Cornus florida TaxID=4283 RepID=UPI0028A09DF4|nr:uncharacterized protein LOC132275952 [Cornus florida]XP_059633151.1 uncharacterized protein LOC132275952 [Cornus florida]